MSELSERASETSEPLDLSSVSSSDEEEVAGANLYSLEMKDAGTEEYAVRPPPAKRLPAVSKEDEPDEVSFHATPKNLVIHSGKIVTFDCVVRGKRPIGNFT